MDAPKKEADGKKQTRTATTKRVGKRPSAAVKRPVTKKVKTTTATRKKAEPAKQKKRTTRSSSKTTAKPRSVAGKRGNAKQHGGAVKQQAPVRNRTKQLHESIYGHAATVAQFPLRIERYAGTFARSAGLAFILIGGLLTVLFSQQVWGAPWSTLNANNVATVCDSSTMSAMQYLQCLSSNTSNQLSSTSNNTQQQLSSTSNNTQQQLSSTSNNTQQQLGSQQPPATFSEDQVSPLHGSVQVTITVTGASQVNLLAIEGSSNTPVVLGSANPGPVSGTWVYTWDTTKFPDDNYQLVADIFNAYHTNSPYRVTDTQSVNVHNTQTASTNTQVTAQPTASTSLLSTQPVWGKAKLQVQVVGAQSVALYARTRTANSMKYLGQAYQRQLDDWRYVWDTTSYANGTYYVQALIKNATGSYHAPSIPVTIDHSAAPATSTPTTTSQLPDQIPSVTLVAPAASTLSDVTDLQVLTASAQFVELYAVPSGSHIERFVGLAQKVDTGVWQVRWDTKNIPNGAYTMYAKIKNAFGTYDSNRINVKVYNKPQQTPLDTQQQKALHELQSQANLLRYASSSGGATVSTSTKRMLSTLTPYYKKLDVILQRYAAAYRVNDGSAMQTVKQQLTTEQKVIVQSVIADTQYTSTDAPALNALVHQHITDFINNLPHVDKLLQERLGANIFQDSDHDGISNYDEVHVYHTNPYSADTDGDGFTDGAEIMSGHDPLNPNPQSVIAYQLPQDNGVQRSDLLSVTSIQGVGKPTSTPAATQPATTTATTTKTNTRPLPQQPSSNEALATTSATPAVITGRGLPNSFVTLYIFSMPIVVTVKTNADGSWQYRFDKELPNGDHTIYVGITDNTGHIIAKSAPFTFVKNAYAYSPTNEGPVSNVASQADSGSLLSQSMLYLIASISVVAIGLILLLLGLHLESRKRMLAQVVNNSAEAI